MPTPLELAQNAHFAALKTMAGVAVTYRRPSSGASYAITAVLLERRQEEVESNVGALKVDFQDFGIVVAELSVVPKRGDLIETGGDTWELMGSATDGPPYEFMDQFKTAYRVHTQLVPRS